MKRDRGTGLVVAGLVFLSLAGSAAAAEPAPLGLSFFKFTVSDMPTMLAFYEKAFGMTVKKNLDNGSNTEMVLASAGGFDLALVHYKDNRKLTLGDADGPLGLYLADVDAAYNRAIAAGAASRTPPRAVAHGRVAMVVDPEGHEIEFLHLDQGG